MKIKHHNLRENNFEKQVFGTPRQCNILNTIKINELMSSQAMRSHGGNLNAFYEVKEANLKRLHVIRFQP